jgi:hypothetical protein
MKFDGPKELIKDLERGDVVSMNRISCSGYTVIGILPSGVVNTIPKKDSEYWEGISVAVIRDGCAQQARMHCPRMTEEGGCLASGFAKGIPSSERSWESLKCSEWLDMLLETEDVKKIP